MNAKIGRNDPCSCGSGKKYKQCCMLKNAPKPAGRKLTAKWINQPQVPNLYDRMFGDAIASTEKEFKQISTKDKSDPESTQGVKETK